MSVWDALDRPRAIDDLVRELADRFGTDPATVRADVVPVIEELVACGALEHRS